MKHGKILVKLIIITFFALVIIILVPYKKAETIEFIKGYIFDSDVDALKQYKNTLINSYDPEPEWNPKEKLGTDSQPEIVGESAIIIDTESGKILFEKSSTKKMKVASLVKIMTLVVALEHKNLDDKIYVSKKAAGVGENSMGISEGEVYTLEELSYGLILVSGNDAAYALSEGVAGNTDRFVEWMNFKAKQIGLRNTHFADPSGLDDNSYSTAADLAKLTRYALKNPEFRKIVKTVEYEATGEKHKYIYLENQTNLLTTYPGVQGVKTGFTEEAGLSLVTYANNGCKELIGVVLKSTDRKGDMILMLDHGYRTLGIDIKHNLL